MRLAKSEKETMYLTSGGCFDTIVHSLVISLFFLRFFLSRIMNLFDKRVNCNTETEYKEYDVCQ